ncbi:MAG: tRNA 2-thiouridine(34) synthase MnmA [Halioglobus sp.]|nr:tRNA 2-thiouridine(34) synthase MnmA [Halioglobus sp.]
MSAPTANDRIVLGMSGGVDSSVAALLLKREGYDVQGLFMVNWEEDEEAYCTAAADFQDARAVCDELDIPLHRVNFAREYRERVFQYFLDEYEAGRTPNPDVLCNREIKFGVFKQYARRLGGRYIATGHYARSRYEDGLWSLLKAKDASKDQTYFLAAVDQQGLADSLFPLGDMHKSEVREQALAAGLDVFRKKDSTGICFIGERDFADFLGQFLPASPGEIQSTDGAVLGEHRGLMFYTLGQRQGLGIGGLPGAPDAPWYVVDKDLKANVLVVAQGHDHPALMSAAATVTDLNWIAGAPPAAALDCTVKVRYRQADQPCHVELDSHGSAIARFVTPQRAVTPGQFAVFYAGEVCLGGGVISERHGVADA